MAFSNLVIAASGNLGVYKHEALNDLVTKHGGNFSEIVDAETTHLVCSAYAYKSRTQKVKSAIEEKSVIIVDVYWIEDSITKRKALSETTYLLPGKKQQATFAFESEEKKNKKRSVESESSGMDTPDEICPQMKRAREKETAKPDGMEAPGEVVEGIEKAVKSGQIIKFDPEWSSKTSVYIYKDQEKTPYVYSKWLGKIDVGTDTSTEILLFQLWELDTKPRQYVLYCGEGSDGTQKAIYGQSYAGSTKGLGGLINVYKSELEKLTLQGYVYIDLDYSLKQHTLEAAPSKKTLEIRNNFYKLLELISGQNTIPEKLEARTAEYDKLALKNISEVTIRKGERILAMLEKSIANPPLTPRQAGIEKVKIQGEDIVKLTSHYYSYVPRLFVANEPIVLLDSREKIRVEIDMLRNLEAIRKSAILAEGIHLQDDGHEDILKERFKSLNLKQIHIVDNDSQEFKLIERYFTNTGGPTATGVLHDSALQIFRIERFGDEERWNKAGWDQKTMEKHDNRRLLWHGTPQKNISMILEGGLKDVHGMNRVYFSDTAKTSCLTFALSIDYCQQYGAYSPPFAVLLCEVQLGHMSPYNTRTGLSTGKIGIQRGSMGYKWSDAGVIHKTLEGVQMPDVEKPNSLPWEHVEWVACHSPSQIKHRYLVIYR